jgi:hypothetical protein
MYSNQFVSEKAVMRPLDLEDVPADPRSALNDSCRRSIEGGAYRGGNLVGVNGFESKAVR